MTKTAKRQRCSLECGTKWLKTRWLSHSGSTSFFYPVLSENHNSDTVFGCTGYSDRNKLKENVKKERKPRCDSFNQFYCGSIAGSPAIEMGKKMGKITVETCEIEGLKVITPAVFGDERGYFMETYNYNDYKEAGLDMEFVQDNQSMSKKGVLRGLHFQINFPQDKLVRVVSGEVFDVAVDLREGSKTYGKWFGVVLSAENKKQFFIPKNFAHGFVVLSDTAEFAYKCTDFYHPNDEGGLAWNDPEIGVKWPIPADMQLIISDKDQKWGGIATLKK